MSEMLNHQQVLQSLDIKDKSKFLEYIGNLADFRSCEKDGLHQFAGIRFLENLLVDLVIGAYESGSVTSSEINEALMLRPQAKK